MFLFVLVFSFWYGVFVGVMFLFLRDAFVFVCLFSVLLLV